MVVQWKINHHSSSKLGHHLLKCVSKL